MVEQRLKFLRQPRSGQTGLEQDDAGPRLLHDPCIDFLMIVRRVRKRYQDRRFSTCCDLRQRCGSTSSNHQIRLTQRLRHVLHKRRDVHLHPLIPIGFNHSFKITFTRLMNQVEAANKGRGLNRLNDDGVQGLGALAPSADQHRLDLTRSDTRW